MLVLIPQVVTLHNACSMLAFLIVDNFAPVVHSVCSTVSGSG